MNGKDTFFWRDQFLSWRDRFLALQPIYKIAIGVGVLVAGWYLVDGRYTYTYSSSGRPAYKTDRLTGDTVPCSSRSC